MPQNVGYTNMAQLPIRPGDTTPNPGTSNIGSKIFSTIVQEDLVYLNGQWTREEVLATGFVTNGDTAILFKGAVVYEDSDGAVFRAIASDNERRKVAGLMSNASTAIGAQGELAASGVFTATAGEWSSVTGLGGGLIPGATYYLSTTAGRLTTIPPVLPGLWVVEIGKAITATDLVIDIGIAILN